MGLRKKQRAAYEDALKNLVKKGTVVRLGNRYILAKNCSFIEAEIVRVNTTYGFARSLKEPDKEYFIPGRGLKGAMPGDKVKIHPNEGRGELTEGVVEEITRPADERIAGTYVVGRGRNYVMPDKMQIPLEVVKKSPKAKDGEKVLAKIVSRGQRHFDHMVSIEKVYGEANIAAVCAEAILDENHIEREFLPEVIAQAEEISKTGIAQGDMKGRADLRGELIFTIDGADTKDIDDAVSLQKTENGYLLGVHIADVSHYVKTGTPLDEDALHRGTSVYFADQVVPMLPPALSNGICSLNPREDRLAFSAWMELDPEGKMTKYRFEKTVICSRVKGVYSEINGLLADEAGQGIGEKYAEVKDTLFLMRELSEKLSKLRQNRGAFELETHESKIVVGEDGRVKDILLRERGTSETIIEEFMLTANEAAASFALDRAIPFIYRVHERPTPEKVAEMLETLRILGLTSKTTDGSITQRQVSALLKRVKGTPLETVINHRVLRMMAKAKYSDQPIGHYGLVLKKYAHFTSPIRRYPDLAIHRIMSYVLEFGPGNAEKKFAKFAVHAAVQSTDREIKAMTVERDCEDCYKAEFLAGHLGETFPGTIVSTMPQGIYVELMNTAQGRIAADTLPAGEYEIEGNIRYRELRSGRTYTIGDSVEVVVAKAEVMFGNVDFVLAECYEDFVKQQKKGD